MLECPDSGSVQDRRGLVKGRPVLEMVLNIGGEVRVEAVLGLVTSLAVYELLLVFYFQLQQLRGFELSTQMTLLYLGL